MTWGEFKRWVEAKGVDETYKLGVVDFASAPLHIYIRTSVLDKDDVEVDIS